MLIRGSQWRLRNGEPIAASEVTPRAVYEGRRAWLKAAAAGAGMAAMSEWATRTALAAPARGLEARTSSWSVMDKPTPLKEATSYNNFYEFGTDKADPQALAGRFRTRPWTVSLEGACAKPQTIGIDELLHLSALEERTYRLRCVEGWSMVIPWIGYSLSELLKRAQPNASARYVEFTSVAQTDTMPGLRSRVLDWPYVEGLRIDEAMHPLTMLVVGMYGEVLPNQNGAPVRLAVPWKYGFKSAKSIVRIRFVDKEPATSWVKAAPQEYGFYSNVNPTVDHPRWSQATERRIPDDGFFSPKRKTLMFNGYEAQVASLYAGMDLRKFF